jgi:hypothetical protein
MRRSASVGGAAPCGEPYRRCGWWEPALSRRQQQAQAVRVRVVRKHVQPVHGPLELCLECRRVAQQAHRIGHRPQAEERRAQEGGTACGRRRQPRRGVRFGRLRHAAPGRGAWPAPKLVCFRPPAPALTLPDKLLEAPRDPEHPRGNARRGVPGAAAHPAAERLPLGLVAGRHTAQPGGVSSQLLPRGRCLCGKWAAAARSERAAGAGVGCAGQRRPLGAGGGRLVQPRAPAPGLPPHLPLPLGAGLRPRAAPAGPAGAAGSAWRACPCRTERSRWRPLPMGLCSSAGAVRAVRPAGCQHSARLRQVRSTRQAGVEPVQAGRSSRCPRGSLRGAQMAARLPAVGSELAAHLAAEGAGWAAWLAATRAHHSRPPGPWQPSGAAARRAPAAEARQGRRGPDQERRGVKSTGPASQKQAHARTARSPLHRLAAGSGFVASRLPADR